MTEMTEGIDMAHITTSATRAEATSPEWLHVGSQIGSLVNEWALRSDLVAYVGPGAGGPAPACYNIDLAEIEVNVDAAFGYGVSAETVGDITTRAAQFDWPKASGAIFHEAMHARFSRWNLKDAFATLSEDEYAALNLLEESRIEKFGVQTMPSNSCFLRACALEIVLADCEESISELTSTRAAAQLAGLTLARVDAGVLKRDDVYAVAEILETFLGEELLAGLRSCWLRMQDHSDHYDITAMYDVAREWARLVNDAAKERGESQEEEQLSEAAQKFIKDMMEALSEDASMASISAQSTIDDQQQTEEWKEQVGTKAAAAKEKNENKKMASEVFSKSTGPGSGTRTRSDLVESRKPTSQERAAAVKIAQMLEKAKYRERDAVDVVSVLPPGRLRTRAMVQGAALKAKGLQAQVEPWRQTKRTHTDDPTLTVGVMVDISGSMSSAMKPMATTAWVMSEAARRVQGKCAMVYYGQDVFPTLKPGQHLTEVNVYSAPDGTEKFDKAFKAMDGALNLLDGTGARLLVVVSDGHYTYEESIAARKWIARCKQAGVAVLWLPFDEGSGAYKIASGSDVVVLTGVSSPADAATEIGKAAAAALTKVGQRNAA
jgi:hypothetical protein